MTSTYVKKMIQDGCDRKKMAKELRVSIRTVGRLLQRLKIRMPLGVPRQVELRVQIMNLVSVGVDNNADLCRVLKRHCAAVHKIVTELVEQGLLYYRDGQHPRSSGKFCKRRLVVDDMNWGKP